jgi:ribosomal-protein-alanine N-acetyltransferase
MQLRTERLLLREFVGGDWPAAHECGSDLQVVRFMPWGPNTEEDTRAFIARNLAAQHESPRSAYEMAVTLLDGGRLIGACGLHPRGDASRSGWIGYCSNRPFWGRGYATEAARALVGFGFRELGLHRIWATCDPDNTASARVLGKLGMQRQGRLREDTDVRGRWRDSFLYGILEQEWQAPA